MSTAHIEDELRQYIESTGYHVRINYGNALHCRVLYQGKQIGNICLLSSWRCHQRAAKKALRIIRDHQKAMQMLGGVS